MLGSSTWQSICPRIAHRGGQWFAVLLACVGWCAAEIHVARAASTRYTFAAFGDYGVGTSAEADVATMVHSWQPDFIITTGDNVYGDTRAGSPDFERLVGAYYGDYLRERADERYTLQRSQTQRFFPSVGNHDVTDRPGQVGGMNAIRPGMMDYFDTDPGRPAGRLPTGGGGVVSLDAIYYTFRRGEAQFFAIDSDAASFDEDLRFRQMNWLHDGLHSSDARWKFVYFHYPAYSSGENGDEPLMQWPFAEWGATAVFSGHDHTYERIERDNISYFVSGLGGQIEYGFFEVTDGSQVRFNQKHGAMRVIYDDEGVQFEFIAAWRNSAGQLRTQVIDTYRLGVPVPEPSFGVMVATALWSGSMWRFRRRST